MDSNHGLNRLVFKKVFSISEATTARTLWLWEISNCSPFQVEPRSDSKDNLVFTIEHGQVGENERERILLERLGYLLGPVGSLNCSTHISDDIPNDLDDTLRGSADEYVRPYITKAFVAVQNFIEAYRDAKYLMAR